MSTPTEKPSDFIDDPEYGSRTETESKESNENPVRLPCAPQRRRKPRIDEYSPLERRPDPDDVFEAAVDSDIEGLEASLRRLKRQSTERHRPYATPLPPGSS